MDDANRHWQLSEWLVDRVRGLLSRVREPWQRERLHVALAAVDGSHVEHLSLLREDWQRWEAEGLPVETIADRVAKRFNV